MRKLIFLLLIAATWYLAGMYHLASFVILSLTEILFVIWMFWLPIHLRKGVSVRFEKEKTKMLKDTQMPCVLLAENRSVFPASCLRIHLCFHYQGMEEKKSTVLYAASRGGETEKLTVTSRLPWCGTVNVTIQKIYYYDYLTMFRRKKKADCKSVIWVFPQERKLRLQLRDRGWNEFSGNEEETKLASGDDHDEIYQTRVYVPGDTPRYIHWKQSARTDELWVKEYQQEQKSLFKLYLDLSGRQEAAVRQLDGFYEILSALLFSLMGQQKIIQVYWEDENGRLRWLLIREKKHVQDLLIRLY